MTPVVASPTSAWTTGQYVVIGDGSHVHWTGTAWVGGPALMEAELVGAGTKPSGK
jgi:hypothetical protein